MIGDYWTKSPTFNPPIICSLMHMYRKMHSVVAVFNKTLKETESYITELIIRVPASTGERSYN